MSEYYLLLKRGYYWRPNAQGYTAYKSEAGLYSFEEASQRINEGVTMIAENEAEHFAPAADEGQQLEYYKASHKEAADEIERLRAELAKCQWQPIETAPKDEDCEIIVSYDHCGTLCVFNAFYRKIDDDMISLGFSKDEEGWWTYPNSSITQMKLWQEPTHWMPLPQPPKVKDRDVA